MDDKELVDKCWDYFIKNEITYSNELEHIGYEGIFRAGFEAAKRSQPSVVLPKGHSMDDPDGMGRGRYLMIESVERAITRAGYNYEVKE